MLSNHKHEKANVLNVENACAENHNCVGWLPNNDWIQLDGIQWSTIVCLVVSSQCWRRRRGRRRRWRHGVYASRECVDEENRRYACIGRKMRILSVFFLRFISSSFSPVWIALFALCFRFDSWIFGWVHHRANDSLVKCSLPLWHVCRLRLRPSRNDVRR